MDRAEMDRYYRQRYTRGPWLAVTRSTSSGTYALQWYWTDGRGGARYNPPIPGIVRARRKDAERVKRELLATGARGQWVEWPRGSTPGGDRDGSAT